MTEEKKMRILKCGRCKKTVEVPDDYLYTRCEICRMKDLADCQIRREKRKLDREARNKIKELKLEKAMSFSEWSKFAKEVLHNPSPTWEQYTEYLKQRKEHEIYDKAERETYRLKAENQKKYALIRFDLFEPSNRRECYSFRTNRLNGFKDLSHLDECESCQDWNYNFVNEMLKPRESEETGSTIETRDDSEFSFERPTHLPDNSLDKFKPKQQTEGETINDTLQQGNIRVESQPEPQPSQQPQESSRDDLNNILNEYDARKKREQSEQN